MSGFSVRTGADSSECRAAPFEKIDVDPTDTGEGALTNSGSGDETTSESAPVLGELTPARSSPVSHGRLMTMLYTSHALSRWGSRMWEFAVVLLLLDIASGSLRLVSIHGVIECSVMAVLGFPIGKLVDHSGRLLLALGVVSTQNIALVIAALVASILAASSFDHQLARNPPATLWESIEAKLGFALYVVGVVIVLVVSAAASVASIGRCIAIERDSVVVLATARADGLETTSETHAEAELSGDSKAAGGVEQVCEITSVEDASKVSKLVGRGLEPLADNEAVQGFSGCAEAAASEEEPETADLLQARCNVKLAPAQDRTHGRPEQGQEGGGTVESRLASTNSILKAIDLTCRLAAPALVGLFMSYLPLPSCCLLLAIWNAASFPLEAWLLAKLYQACPRLHGSPCKSLECGTHIGQRCGRDRRDSTPCSDDYREYDTTTSQDEMKHPSQRGLPEEAIGWATDALGMIKVFCRQPTLGPALSLALLYLTVLSFGDVMTAYLKAEGVPVGLLGLLSATAAVTGIAGTAIFPVACQRFGVARTGQLASFLQWICLVPSAVLAGMAAGRYAVSPWPLVGSVVSSRIGLWMFDLSALQIVQMGVVEAERGQVGGVQGALQQVMEIMSFTICVVADAPKQFWIPVVISFASVSASCVLFQAYCFVNYR